MLTRREALDEARQNIGVGTQKAADLRETASTQELRDLANAIYWIGYGAQQSILAFTERGRVNDL